MSTEKTAIVIGAGIGGIVTAARLAQHGYRVTVVEKNSEPGGRCGHLERDGHHFDTGPTLFLMPEVFAETYHALGEEMHDHLDLRRIDPTYRVYFEDGTSLGLTADLNAMQTQLEAIEPGSFNGFLRYLAEGEQHYRVSLERFVGRNFTSLWQYFSLKNLPLMFKLKALVKHYDNVGHYFSDPRLKAAFTFQNMYLGLSPYDAPATYSLLQYTELADGVWFPLGGLYRVIESLAEMAMQKGVRFWYDAPVKQILVDGKRATGVELENGEPEAASGRTLTADLIIANADLPYVYQKLLPHSKTADQLEQKKYTCSAIMFYWGVAKQYPQLRHHNVFLAGDYRASFDRIFNDLTLPDQPSFYVNAPTRTDPTMAPPGQDSLMVLMPVGHLDARTRQDWEALKEQAREVVLKRLANELHITDLKQQIKFEVSYTPVDWQQKYNLAKGAAFGLSHNFRQVGYLRPQNKHPHYQNLYFVGASTHPGTGLPIVLLSARLTTERILAEAKSAPTASRLETATAV
jgi:phytoene desaturase